MMPISLTAAKRQILGDNAASIFGWHEQTRSKD